MLSLPFYLSKRQEKPVLRNGQAELALFKELTGEDYFSDSSVRTDLEQKITEFDYEKYLNADLLEGVDTQSDDFKMLVRRLNYSTKTRLEALQ